MADTAVSLALRTLQKLASTSGGSFSDVKHQVKALETQLMEMKSLLVDAGNRRNESRSVATWIAEITDLACRAEDLIETHAYSRIQERLPRRFIRRPSCAAEITRITREMERIGRRMNESGFLICDGAASAAADQNIQWTRQTAAIDTGDCFVGKQNEVDRLVSIFTGDGPVVISLWGMGGIGKTTVARKAYNHAAVKRGFDCCAWVCVTQRCEMRSVFEEILRQLNPRDRDEMISRLSDAQLIQRLLCIQQEKRCMIVVDDIWEMDQWRGLKSGLIVEGATSSRILLTTRKEKVADVGFPIKLGLLNSDDAWELLKRKARPHIHIPDFATHEKSLEKMGKEMVRKCGYLPLVISILGGFLSKRKSVGEWDTVYQKIADYLYRGDDIENETEFHQVLSLSYYDLPHYLKSCFLYMGAFKEDEAISADDLYWLWIAHGMIPEENNQASSSMDIAKLYLCELASRCLVQVETGNGKKVKSCKLHDVVRQLCLKMGEAEDFGLQNLSYRGGQFSSLLHGVNGRRRRHVVVHLERDVEPKKRISHHRAISSGVGQIRSLQLLHDGRGSKIRLPRSILDFRKLRLLRVVVFLQLRFAGRKLPRGIGDLIHLKCLRIQLCEFDKLPRSVGRLIYLHTLDLKYSWNVRVPGVVKKLFDLKHLILPSYDRHRIGNRYRLRLDEGLDELETLEGFHSLIHELESITRMKNLRRFSGTICDNERLSAVIDAVHTKWEHLEECEVLVNHGCELASREDVVLLKNLLGCRKLHVLKLSVPVRDLMKELEREVIIGAKLMKLVMWLTEVETSGAMEILGKLPFLENLSLLHNSFVGEDIVCRDLDFPRLKKLVLTRLPNLREWRVEEGAMPLAAEIEINGCPRLEMIPDGLRFVSNLEKLTLIRMPELQKRVLEIKEDGGGEGEDFDKIRHVPSIIIHQY